MNKVIKKCLLLTAVLFLSAITCAASDAKPTVTVMPLSVSEPDNVELNIISQRTTETAQLILKFMDEYEFVKNTSSQPESYTAETLTLWCEKEKIDNIVFGRAYSGGGDTYLIEMSVFNRETESSTFSKTVTAESALEILESADRITFSLIEGFSGRHIAFGTVTLKPSGPEGDFLPFIDGEEYPANTTRFGKVLTGERKIEIYQQRMLGPRLIHSEDITVADEKETLVTIAIPWLLPEEEAEIAKSERVIEKNRAAIRQYEKVEKAYDSIDQLLSDTEYNRSLQEVREKYRQERALWKKEIDEIAASARREFIIGLKGGVNNSFIFNRNRDDDEYSSTPHYNEDWNDEAFLGPVIGATLQLQVTDRFYLQTECNYLTLHFFEDRENDFDNFLEVIEVPVMVKYMRKTGIGRFSALIGPSFLFIINKHGFFDYVEDDPLNYPYLSYRNPAFGFTFGLEYGFKIGNHVFSADARFLSANLMSFTYNDPFDNNFIDFEPGTNTIMASVGYGYNFGGSGELHRPGEKSRWLLPAGMGIIFDTSKSSHNTFPAASAGALYGITDSVYLGITGLGIAETGGGAMITAALAKDPDRLINSISFFIMPMKDTVVWMSGYNIAIKRFMLGTVAGGDLRDFSHFSAGFMAGYYF